MRVLFTTHATSGHYHPLVPLAKALEEAGHKVALVTSEFFCQFVEASGFDCLPGGYDLGMHWSEATFENLSPEYAEVPQGLEKMRWMASNIFAGLMLERMVPDLLVHVDEWQSDLLVRNPSGNVYRRSSLIRATGRKLSDSAIALRRCPAPTRPLHYSSS